MKTLLLSQATLDAMSEWNAREGRGMIPAITPVGDKFRISIDEEVSDRLEQVRFEGETDDALVWSMLTFRLAASETLPSNKRDFCRTIMESIRESVLGAREEPS